MQGNAVIRVDKDGRVRFASAGCTSVGGISADVLEGSWLWENMHEDDAVQLKRYFEGSRSFIHGTIATLRYRRQMLGLGVEDEHLPLFFSGEWVSVEGSESEIELIGFERRLGPHNTEDPGPVVWDPTRPAPDVGPDPRKTEAERREAERKAGKERVARRAVRSAYFELTNALHGVSTVAIALRDNVAAMGEASKARDDGAWVVDAPDMLQQDVRDLVASSKQADMVSKDIQVLDRGEDESPGSEPMPVFAKLHSAADSLALLATGTGSRIFLVLGDSVPVLPIAEGSDVLSGVQTAVAHGLRVVGEDRWVLVTAGVHADQSSRLVVEVVHPSCGLEGVTMEGIKSALSQDDNDGSLSTITSMRRDRLCLMGAVLLQLCSHTDGTVDISESRGMLRVALSIPWKPSSREAVKDSGVADVEAAARSAHNRDAAKHAVAVNAALAGGETPPPSVRAAAASAASASSAFSPSSSLPSSSFSSSSAAAALPSSSAAASSSTDEALVGGGEGPLAVLPPVSHLRHVPALLAEEGANSSIAAGSKVPSLLPDGGSGATPEAGGRAAAAAASGAPPKAKEGQNGRGRKTKAERQQRRAKRQAARAAAGGTTGSSLPPGLVGHPERMELRGRTVLLVDDVAMVRRTGEQMLSRLGMACDVLEDGDEIPAAMRSRSQGYDAILLDIMMPRMSGDKMCKQLRNEMLFQRPIIAMTGHTGSADVVRYYDYGFDVVLRKPFTLDELAESLVEAMQRRGNSNRMKRAAARIDETGATDELGMKQAKPSTPVRGAASNLNLPASGWSQEEDGSRSSTKAVAVTAVNPSLRAAPQPRGSLTPTRFLDVPIGARDGELSGRGELDDPPTSQEPVLGLHRGNTIGVAASMSSAPVTAFVRNGRAVTAGVDQSGRHIEVSPPGAVNS